jgi:hypothetical protein
VNEVYEIEAKQEIGVILGLGSTNGSIYEYRLPFRGS